MHILLRKPEITYDFLKTKIFKRYLDFVLFTFFRNISANIEKKNKQRKRRSGEMLMLVFLGVKALKMSNLLNSTSF